ncbi:MAG: hypothetical protein F6K11_07510 [Leptolyngbya sp. SIO3F4]|nr:hypothetical protein [Leptolyngbya sp. SIO3F4]
MSHKKDWKMSSNISAKSSKKDKSDQLWQTLTETEQEIAKGGFGFPGFPGGPIRPGDGRQIG